jgi:8-oxo-dGTP pyrophosphatase MutT (NUDIX family)
VFLSRVNPLTKKLEALVVHKRHTYAYAEFVLGRYMKHTPHTVTALLDWMTTEELLDIWSLNFEQIMFRYFLKYKNSDIFEKKRIKFESSWLRADGGAYLRQLVLQARALGGSQRWEYPRGRLDVNESMAMAATRELYEEAHIDRRNYFLLPGVTKQVSYVSAGVRYVFVFYIAIMHAHLAEVVSTPLSRPLKQGSSPLHPPHLGEVNDSRWMSIEQLRMMDGPDRLLETVAKPGFNLVKKYMSLKWDARRGNNGFAVSSYVVAVNRKSDAIGKAANTGKVVDTGKTSGIGKSADERPRTRDTTAQQIGYRRRKQKRN